MGIRFIRQPSDEPNISNADDARMIRYSYGGYNGYIKGKGAELSATPNGLTFKINSGVVVLHGYETEIDSNGWEMTIVSTPTRHYFSVYYEVNLATQTVKIDSVYDTAGYPTIDEGDNLTSVSVGTAKLLLYQFTAASGVIADVNKKVAEISYTKALIESEAITRNEEDNNIVTAITDGTLVAEKAKRDNNGDIIPNTYRKKSERVLFFEGEFQSGGNYKTLTRNVGSATITSNSFLEIEFGFGETPAYRRRQVVRAGNSTLFESGIVAGGPSTFVVTANVQVENSTSLRMAPARRIVDGVAENYRYKIYRIWVVE